MTHEIIGCLHQLITQEDKRTHMLIAQAIKNFESMDDHKEKRNQVWEQVFKFDQEMEAMGSRESRTLVRNIKRELQKRYGGLVSLDKERSAYDLNSTTLSYLKRKMVVEKTSKLLEVNDKKKENDKGTKAENSLDEGSGLMKEKDKGQLKNFVYWP